MKRARLAVLCLTLYALGSLYIVVALAADLSVNFMIIGACTVTFFLFSLLHASMMIGSRNTSVFLAVSFSVSLLFELLGTAYGWIYGAYSYTDRLGPKILGLVPVLIPLAWFMMIYASCALANVLAFGHPWPAAQRPTAARLLWLVLLSAMIMTSWDLINDPINVHGGHWVWADGGDYFGIPLSNYAGWMLTTLVVYLLYRLYEASRLAQLPSQKRAGVSVRFWWLPIIGFTITMLANVATLVIAGLPAQAMVGLFSMGAFLAAAVARRL